MVDPFVMKRRVFVFGALGLALSCCACWNLVGRAICREQMVINSVSPDRRYVAELYVDDCYMDGGARYAIDIVAQPETWLLWWHPDRVTALEFDGGMGWWRRMIWKDEHTLVI